MLLLDRVIEKLQMKEIEIINTDSVIICEKPKILPFISKMKDMLSEHMHIDSNQISIKGKTSEGLGFAGRKQGIAVYSVSLLRFK